MFENLRKEQLEYLKYWNRTLIIPNRKKLKYHNFAIDSEYISKLTVEDLVEFAKDNNMYFESTLSFLNHTQIIFRDMRSNIYE